MREVVRRVSVGSIVRGFIWLRDLRALTAERRFRELGLDVHVEFGFPNCTRQNEHIPLFLVVGIL